MFAAFVLAANIFFIVASLPALRSTSRRTSESEKMMMMMAMMMMVMMVMMVMMFFFTFPSTWESFRQARLLGRQESGLSRLFSAAPRSGLSARLAPEGLGSLGSLGRLASIGRLDSIAEEAREGLVSDIDVVDIDFFHDEILKKKGTKKATTGKKKIPSSWPS
jgi:hypothetical protein